MTRAFANSLKTGGLVALLGLAGLAATTTSASAHYRTTRCDGDGDRCAVLRCDDDGDRCYRIRSYHRDDRYGRRYEYHHRDDYGRRHSYWARRHDRDAHIGLRYRWGD